MKKLYPNIKGAILLTVFLSISAIAQTSWKTNGNNLTGGEFLGTISDDPLIFRTNSIDRMKLKKNGGLNIFGFLEADSAKITGMLHITSGGGSFFFVPNVFFPFPPHDLITVSAQYDNQGNLQYPASSIKTVKYDAFIGLLIKSVQEQQNTIDSLRKKDSVQSAQVAQILSSINSLSTAISSCCNSSSRVISVKGNETNQLNIDLSDKDVIVLNQNVPNPFAEQTTITYNVPEQYGFAQIIFKTIDGKIIKAVDITKKGKGQLNVFANDLSHGLYMYSLIVDGKVIDTMKMVKE